MTDEEALTPAERAARTKRLRTRKKLVEAAVFWVNETGIDARAEDIAEDAGVSVATYYNVFKTRADLFNTLMITQCYVPLQNVIRDPGTLEHVALTQDVYFGGLSALIQQNLNVVRGLLSTRYDEPLRRTLHDAIPSLVQAIMVVSGAWLEERGWSDEDRVKVRAATTAAFVGALDHAVYHPTGFHLEDVLIVPPPNALQFKAD